MEIIHAQLKTDIVIVGAGGAGLTATVAALEAGAKDIILLEKAVKPGGNTAQSAGMFAVGSPTQNRKGITVSVDEVFREKMTYANWRIDPKLVRKCIEKSGEIVQWLENRGMTFDSVVEFLRENETPKVFHLFSPGPSGFIGKKITETLAEECKKNGVRIFCESAAKKILVNHQGVISGVQAATREGQLHIDTKSVILSTGGFGANRELLNRFFPGHSNVFTLNFPEMTGDGLVMAEELNAVIDSNMMLLLTGPHHYPWSHCLTLLVRRPDILLVNKNGVRYCDETIFLDYHTEAGNILSRQPDKICYGLVDAKIINEMIAKKEIISGMEREAGGAGAWLNDLEMEIAAKVASGTVKKADSWDKMADQLSIDRDILDATVKKYNSYCDTGYDEEFVKEKEFLLPLRTPPFYAVLGRQGFDTTLGGIKVNHNMQVISKLDRPIMGLYATGDCASGWEFANYNLRHPGSAMTFALCSGFFAGEHAARYVTDETEIKR